LPRCESNSALQRGVGDKQLAVGTSVTSLFEQPWWLEAVAPGYWDQILVKRGDQIVARWPYVLSKRYGLTVMSMPPLTPTLGPWLMITDAKYATEISRETELLGELIERLPSVDYICQVLSPLISNWLPFYWAGFEQTTHYTYRLLDISNPEAIWSGMRSNIRREIRKAEKLVAIRSDLGIDNFLPMVEMTFQRQGKNLPYKRELVYRLDTACATHGSRRMFFAEDATNRIHAAAYIVWDRNVAYYLMGGANPELRNSGAHSFVLWEAINFCASVTAAFDFEGSALRAVEPFFRAFGGRPLPCSIVRRMSRRARLLNSAREFCRALFLP
jgi:Acetyltransferase (GNAT) domain